MKTISISIIILFLCFSCNNKKTEVKETKLVTSHFIKNDSYQDTIEKYINEWKKDSIGCLKLRNQEKGRAILRFLRKGIVSKEVLYKNFGKPNKKEKTSDYECILTYNYDCLCSDKGKKRNADYCFVSFYITADTL